MSIKKTWGGDPFFGLGFDFDPQWLLNDVQKKIQADLIELSRSVMRDNAVESDKKYLFPRKNFEALASQGLLGLFVPKELGGLGENHVTMTMVVETIARYACPSTAMCLTMHYGAVAALLFRHHNNQAIQNILKKLDSDVLIGTLSYSDPETGGHFWFPMSSNAARVEEGWCINKKASWTTSGGFADWYVVQTTSPNFNGDYSNLSCFVVTKDEVIANTGAWDGMGLRGNQSGSLEVKNQTIPLDRLVGQIGDGAASNDETVDPFFLLLSSACWNGISLGLIDLAKAHVTKKKHADVGMRVCDYPTIQDYFGEAIIDTSSNRAMDFMLARALDDLTQNCDWSVHQDAKALPRTALLHWLWMLKFSTAKNVTHVTDKMLHACGGSAFKEGMGIARLLRDGKAGWVMGPSNEILRQFVGKMALLGVESLDYWNQSVNLQLVNNEIKKMDKVSKKQLAEQLLSEAT